MAGPISFRLQWFDALLETPNDAEHGGIDAMARAVAAVLHKHMKADGTCYPGTRTLAAQSGMSHPTAEKRVARLEEAGWLEVRRRNGAVNMYLATIPDRARRLRGRHPGDTRRHPATPGDTAQPQNGTAQPQNGTAQPQNGTAQRRLHEPVGPEGTVGTPGALPGSPGGLPSGAPEVVTVLA